MNPDDRDLKALENRIREARKTGFPEPPPQADEGLQAGIEMIGAVVGGGLLGYALDALFDTRPFLLIVFFILGIGAGFLSVWKITQGIGTGVGFAPLHKREKGAKHSPEQDVEGHPDEPEDMRR